MKESIKYLTDDMKKIPNRVSDRIGKDIEPCKSSQHNYNQTCTENKYLKSPITSLTRENQSQSNELWELKHKIRDQKSRWPPSRRLLLSPKLRLRPIPMTPQPALMPPSNSRPPRQLPRCPPAEPLKPPLHRTATFVPPLSDQKYDQDAQRSP